MINTLYQMIEDNKINLIERDLTPLDPILKGLYFDNVILLDNHFDTQAELKCVLAEEIGHYHTSVGDILDKKVLHKEKEEEKAGRWAVDKLINPNDFIAAYNAGVRNRAELAEFLDVTEEFIEIALKHFTKVYGDRLILDKYTVFFDPLWVFKEL